MRSASSPYPLPLSRYDFRVRRTDSPCSSSSSEVDDEDYDARRKLPSYHDFCKGVLPAVHSTLSPMLQQSLTITDEYEKLSINTPSPALAMSFSPFHNTCHIEGQVGNKTLRPSQWANLNFHTPCSTPFTFEAALEPRFYDCPPRVLSLEAEEKPPPATSLTPQISYGPTEQGADSSNADDRDGIYQADLEEHSEALKNVKFYPDPSLQHKWARWTCDTGMKDNGHALFKCVHPLKQKKSKDDAASDGICGYIALKQTVKRHVNSLHLQLRPFKCTFCNEAFSQRQAAMVHVNIHLGLKPHACEFCGARYSDPSRKNKHVSKDHGDQNVRRRRKNPYAHIG